MAQPIIHNPVQFFVGVIISEMELWDNISRAISSNWGEIEFSSEKVDFDQFTQYYQSEMGTGLTRFWFALEGIRFPDDLIRIKWSCTAIENSLTQDKNRRVNLDPGYITEAKVILASFKDFAHRIYLTEGVYADMQLIWRDGKFIPREWTFADYRSDIAQKFFTRLRETYRRKLKLYIQGELEPIRGGGKIHR
ncbi:hypothetical protein DRQ33_01445 [bacterium]|nr:MAG: hypothetical protein DRQ33_01445 [bacterium]